MKKCLKIQHEVRQSFYCNETQTVWEEAECALNEKEDHVAEHVLNDIVRLKT